MIGARAQRCFAVTLVRCTAFFRNKVNRDDEIEDLIQQALLASVEAHKRFRGDSSFRTFLLSIARNVLFKYIRGRSKHGQIDADALSLADCGLGVSSVINLRREQQLLLTALRHISLDSQLVLELYYWEQATAAQIAKVLDTSESAVRGRLRKAKLELRAVLAQLARDPTELASTVDGLDEWAASLREQWS